jgi:hypothetical protein
MTEKPRRLVADAKRTVHLMGRYTLLAGGHQEQRGKPFGERNFAALENGFDRDRELLAALATLKEARTVGLTL